MRNSIFLLHGISVFWAWVGASVFLAGACVHVSWIKVYYL